MKTLDEIIKELQRLREEVGHDCHVFVDGWNDTGIVAPNGPRITHVRKTEHDEDGEVTRAWEEFSGGDAAVVIQ